MLWKGNVHRLNKLKKKMIRRTGDLLLIRLKYSSLKYLFL